MQGKVEICGVNTARLKTLTQEEMDTLLLRAQKGDKQARQALIEGNLRLVLSVIQRFDKRGECPDDLFQVGCIGLIKAISNFDPTKNVRFSTYGVPMIVESRNTTKGVSTMTRKQAITKAIAALQQEGGNDEAIQVLVALSAELPIIHWSDATLRDTVDQFIADTGRMPAATDFKNPGMPPYRVFMCNYGLTPTEWLQANYPEHYPSQQELMDRHTKAFIEDYLRLKPKSADDFNERRSDKSRGWRSVARYHHLGTWTSLIRHLNLPKYSENHQGRVPSKVKVVVHNDYDFRD